MSLAGASASTSLPLAAAVSGGLPAFEVSKGWQRSELVDTRKGVEASIPATWTGSPGLTAGGYLITPRPGTAVAEVLKRRRPSMDPRVKPRDRLRKPLDPQDVRARVYNSRIWHTFRAASTTTAGMSDNTARPRSNMMRHCTLGHLVAV